MSTEKTLVEASTKIRRVIKIKLLDKDMKQIDLANKLNVPKSTLSLAINGCAGKRFEHIRKQIYKELGISNKEV